jgi:hypothetical protein
VDRAAVLLDGRIESRTGDRLVVRETDPAALNAALVGAGVAVTEITVERRTLEEVVVEMTGPGSDQFAGGGPA